MNKSNFILLTFLFFPLLIFAQNEIPKGDLVWSDEFDGTGIPDISKWDRPEYNRRNNDNGPDGWWSKQDSYLDGNGNLVIRVRKIDNKNNDNDPYDYSVGAVRTKGKFEKLYGVFEIRCKLPTQQGWWVAFWMMQGNVGSELNGGVDGSEVDIMEAFGWTDKINQAVHWDGYGDAHKSTGQKTEVPGIREGYHTYTLQWTPEKYLFYIDGKKTWESAGGGVCNQPGYVKITGELSTQDWATNEYWSQNPANAQYPDSFLVDYVRVYNLPDEELPPIRELVKKCYPEENLAVGSACHVFNLGTQTEEILDREFGYVTPANSFKQSYIHPEPEVWNWTNPDKWLKHCREHNQVMRLHAPISPQCSPWAKDDRRTAAELEQNLTEYMTAVCQRYNDSSQVKWLDVVNETVYHKDGSWFGPDDGSDTWNNPWPRIGFDETSELRPPLYIKKAFEIANEHGTNLKLIINQHGGMEPFIWDKIKKLVKYLRENNLRIDGIGWQAHIWLGWEKQAGNMERLAELIDWCHANDLEFHITEFNVWLRPEDLGKLEEQAATFHAITKLAAKKAKTGFVGINYWHIRGVETQNKDRDGGPWAENYEPKEAYFKIKDALCEASPVCRGDCGPERLQMDIDTFGTGSNTNLLNGEWQSFSDANSFNSLDLQNQDGYDGRCAKFEWTLKKGAVLYPYSGCITYLNAEKTGINVTDYDAIKFKARGTGILKVGLVTSQTQTEGNHYFKTVQLKNDWTSFEIPFSDITQNNENSPLNQEDVVALIFAGAGDFDKKGQMWLDNLQLINKYAMSQVEEPEPPKPPLSYQPKVNQTGYLPETFKAFSVTADNVSPNRPFAVIDENNDEVFSGNLNSETFDDTAISGEYVLSGNFSGFKIPGTYRIKVDSLNSFPFQIGITVYDSLLFHSLRSFYLFRANETINDPVTGLSHPEGHPGDASVSDGQGNFLDLTGGWYNAGDFGKFVPTTAFACSALMNLYEINPGYFALQDLKIPESNNNLPDVLDEVKTGLNWLLKMQRADGAVYHKLDSEPDFAWGYGPDEDPFERKLADPEHLSTIDAADFTATLAHASRVFATFDSLFSEHCRTAAVKSWEWMQAHPGIGQEDIYYTDPQSWQEEMWAKAEIYMLTGDQGILGSFYSDLSTRPLSEPEWAQPQLLSFSGLYAFPGIPATVKSRMKQKVLAYANQVKSVVDDSGYGCAIDKFGWGWGSNIKMANLGAVFICAHQITGDDAWLKYAGEQLNYLMGRNSLNYSFVTGYGKNSCTQPYHWISKTYGIIPKGWLVQGASGTHLLNNSAVDSQVKELMKVGFPSAKTYTDTISSWNSNEVGIYSMSSFAFLTGYLSVHNRQVESTQAPLLVHKNKTELKITARNYSLFCTDCSGKTEVDLYSICGRLLDKKIVNAVQQETKLINYKKYLDKLPLILFRVADATGLTGSGKLNGYPEH